MRRLFCYGKADYCDKDTCTGECEFHDGSGSEYRKIDTMADRIRSMSDEELAVWIQNLMDEGDTGFHCQQKKECQALLEQDKVVPEEWCKQCMVAWLQKPIEKPPLPFGIHDDRQESGLLEDD